MPNRIVKESIKTSYTLRNLSDNAFRTFIHIMVTLDDYGRFHGDIEVLRSMSFPFGNREAKEFDSAIVELEAAGLLRFYSVGDRRYCECKTFSWHQGGPRAKSSKYPPDSESERQVVDSTFAGSKLERSKMDTLELQASDNKGDSKCIQMFSDVPVFGIRNTNSIYDIRKPLFDLFWNEYPRKEAKRNAHKAFMKLHPSEELFGLIMSALSVQKAHEDWLKSDGQFIPYAATWLNGRRWEDQKKIRKHPSQDHREIGSKPEDFSADVEKAAKKNRERGGV